MTSRFCFLTMEEKMKDTAEFTLTDEKGLHRIYNYLKSLLKIVKLKNEDSKESPEGGAVCHIEIEIKAKTKWV